MVKDKSVQLEINAKDLHAVGYRTEDAFLVKEGSLVRKDINYATSDRANQIRDELLAEGVLEPEGDQLRFTKDYPFSSPSRAAMVVLGRNANGWDEWRTPEGILMSKAMSVSRDSDTPLLTEDQKQKILEKYQQLLSQNQLATEQQYSQEYARFRERFGPQVLAGLDGEALLNLLQDPGNRDGLIYWLEFKNDEEFETRRYGGIAGGSALKYRVFKRKETGHWQAADKSNYPHDISIEEAIEIARSHRDQLLQGVEILEAFPENASDEDYALLQDQMDELAPDVSRLGWGHKYFSLLFPDKLDDFQSPDWQRFYILKLLQLPPEGNGRYINACRFVPASREVGIPIVNYSRILNALYGDLHRYWRVGTTGGKTQIDYWPMMKDTGCIAIGWPKLGNLSWVDVKTESRSKLKKLIHEKYPNNSSAEGRATTEVTNFVARLNEGDFVWAANGSTILGVGRVTGEYRFNPKDEFPHQRPVEWLNLDEWKMPVNEGLQSTFREIKKHSINILETERRIQSSKSVVKQIGKGSGKKVVLTGVPGRIQSILERKGQVILYGPPGTGKTYWAEQTARDLAAISALGKRYEVLDESEKRVILGDDRTTGMMRFCCFHPAYGYEDFLEGYRPESVDGQVSFTLRDGVFKQLCKDAAQNPEKNFYLIIDEINRGDIPRIFGELLTILEKDKRTKRIILLVSQESFTVPENVFLIGTMNTADRSISLLDAALRRRFGFYEMMPDGSVLKDTSISGIPLRAWFDSFNTRIREYVGRDARNLQIGHSYLMQSGSPIKSVAALKRIIRDDLIPLLEEYCYEDYSTLAIILGNQIVDEAGQRIRQELFEEGQETALVQALLSPCPEISASSEAMSSEASQLSDETDEEEDETEELKP
ncbi:DUF4357 domain-containing protein [Gimesia aquarii]|uniref:5-methylcytosine-specific restriction enzyme B n=1 Tax=Gimesia aquarii TaxID=2527964 RepID=A0A517WUX9_9PLAN|nr:DUF4357 domain-containing protein [Gimesia aquarii]QDU09063.1 5-methylcytosine-specific restriction enzyme B [Gimesia aquarii]